MEFGGESEPARVYLKDIFSGGALDQGIYGVTESTLPLR